jgi:hypothetical protein
MDVDTGDNVVTADRETFWLRSSATWRARRLGPREMTI